MYFQDMEVQPWGLWEPDCHGSGMLIGYYPLYLTMGRMIPAFRTQPQKFCVDSRARLVETIVLFLEKNKVQVCSQGSGFYS